MKSLPSTTLQLQSTHYNFNLCLENIFHDHHFFVGYISEIAISDCLEF